MSWTAQKINNLFLTPSHPVAGSFMAQNFQKSKKSHQLQRKCFNFKPLIPTHPGEAVLGDTGRGREDEGRSKKAGKEEGGRREERGRSEGGGGGSRED